MISRSFGLLVQLLGSLIGVGYLASYVFNALLAKRQGKNPVLWFFLSYPFGPLVSIYLYRSLKRAERVDAQKTQAKEAEGIRKKEELAAGHVRKEIIRKKELEQQEESRRQQEESRRVAAFHADYRNSRFKRPPKDFNEWKKTSADFSLLLRLLKCIEDGLKDSEVAPNFPVKGKEVVFLDTFGTVTNHDGTVQGDWGDVYITNKRVVVDGQEKTLEWTFSQMINFNALDLSRTAFFKSTDQPVVKGVLLSGPGDWFEFRFFLKAAFDAAKFPIADQIRALAVETRGYEEQKPSQDD